MALSLDKRSFLALSAVGWADGSLQRIEAVGLLRAAKESGLSEADLAEIEGATKKQIKLDELDLSGMSLWDQAMTYALAAWFAQLDGVLSTSEHTVMQVLGEKMGLAESIRKRASAVAYDIACLPEGGRPERYDFVKLAARLGERMPQLKKPASTSAAAPATPADEDPSNAETKDETTVALKPTESE